MNGGGVGRPKLCQRALEGRRILHRALRRRAAIELAEVGSRNDTLTRVLTDVRGLREKLATVLELHTDTRSTGAVVIPPELRACLVDALSRSDLTGSPARWVLRVRQPSDLPDLLAVLALDLLQSHELHRLRCCEGPGCGWFFLDDDSVQELDRFAQPLFG